MNPAKSCCEVEKALCVKESFEARAFSQKTADGFILAQATFLSFVPQDIPCLMMV